MSDFSLFSLFTAGLACLVPLTAAYTQPVGDEPQGNPISEPGLNSVVPVGKDFAVTWKPTTSDTVTLVLLKGPSSNAVPQYAIVEHIKNSGRYIWTPSDKLAPSDASSPAMGYGIQLIDDATGHYQYTTQFGISNPDYKESKSSSSAAEYSSTKSSEPAHYSTGAPVYTTYCPHSTTLTMYNHTYTTSGSVTITKPMAYSTMSAMTTAKHSNVTMVAPTGYKPSGVMSTAVISSGPSATYQGITQHTGAASANVAKSIFGLVAAAGAAVLAF